MGPQVYGSECGAETFFHVYAASYKEGSQQSYFPVRTDQLIYSLPATSEPLPQTETTDSAVPSEVTRASLSCA